MTKVHQVADMIARAQSDALAREQVSCSFSFVFFFFSDPFCLFLIGCIFHTFSIWSQPFLFVWVGGGTLLQVVRLQEDVFKNATLVTPTRFVRNKGAMKRIFNPNIPNLTVAAKYRKKKPKVYLFVLFNDMLLYGEYKA